MRQEACFPAPVLVRSTHNVPPLPPPPHAVSMVYGLNAKIGRQLPPYEWNISNIEAFLTHVSAADKGQPAVVELGNEVNVFNCSGNAANMSASQCVAFGPLRAWGHVLRAPPPTHTHTHTYVRRLVSMYAALRERLDALLPGVEFWGSDPSITGGA